jgi:hypothetical protein
LSVSIHIYVMIHSMVKSIVHITQYLIYKMVDTLGIKESLNFIYAFDLIIVPCTI